MSAHRAIVGPDGTAAAVGSSGGVHTNVRPTPARDLTAAEVGQKKLLTGELKTAAGSKSMTVDGSSAAVLFNVSAPDAAVAWVCEVRLVFHDSNMDIGTSESRRFGSAAAAPGLTNGLRLCAHQGGVVTDLFTTPVMVIGDFYRYAGLGTGAGGINQAIVNDRDAIANGVDFLMVILTMVQPIGLFPGTQDRLELAVQDDLTSLTLFETVYAGWQESL